MGCRQVHVVQTAHVLNMYNLEDIMDTDYNLDIGAFGIHGITTFWEIHQFVAACILRQIGIVLVGEVTPEGVHGDVFTPLQLLDEGIRLKNLPFRSHESIIEA